MSRLICSIRELRGEFFDTKLSAKKLSSLLINNKFVREFANMIIGKNGEYTHVAQYNDVVGKHNAVTTEGIVISDTYNMTYVIEDADGATSHRAYKLSKTGSEICSSLTNVLYMMRTPDGLFQNQPFDEQLRICRLRAGQILIAQATRHILGTGIGEESKIKKMVAPQAFEMCRSAWRGNKKNAWAVSESLAAYMWIKFSSLGGDSRSLVITDKRCAPEWIQQKVEDGSWRSDPGFGRLWNSEAEFIEKLSGGILVPEFLPLDASNPRTPFH